MFMARPMVVRGLGYTISLESAAEAGIREGTLAVRQIESLRLDRIIARSAEHSPSRAVLEVTKLLTTILRDRFPAATLGSVRAAMRTIANRHLWGSEAAFIAIGRVA